MGREGEYQLHPQLIQGPAGLGGRAGRLVFGAMLEDRMAVGVEGQGNAAAPYQALQQPEVAAAVLLIAEGSALHGAGGVSTAKSSGNCGPALPSQR